MGDEILDTLFATVKEESRLRMSWTVDGSNYTVDEAANCVAKFFLTSCQPDSGSDQRGDKNKLAFLKLAEHFMCLEEGTTTFNNSTLRSLFSALVVKSNTGASKHFA